MKEHTHDYKWTPNAPTNFNVRIEGKQQWYKCYCGSYTLTQTKKRVSKTRKKK